ncbi:FixH family protein [Thiothrix fructosivorans]|jgi:hypothetical protein|uniref:FixH family protein n=1 Tax=Thiothrix fructosivorans TaxID=111770 RepID=A0A8B0SIM6_9GAMM|nr:FixH family protein [Thiothrix fructosivorans]MBO0614811.1 FixH family protein [Thiothrix fructosivorans]QTX09627.1 FixH family protein [Thiothrix fructosivorans]
MQVEDTKPWYQQFWPWAVMSLPATAVVAGLYTYSIAAAGSSGLVVGDYYNVGKAINVSLAKGQRAVAMGLMGNVSINGKAVRLLLDNAEVEEQQQLTLNFYHATMPNHDQVVTLQQTGSGVWDGQLQVLAAGKWQVDVVPTDGSWRLTGTLPNAAATMLTVQPAL